MKGGLIGPPNIQLYSIPIANASASMKGGLIGPPNGAPPMGQRLLRRASMKGGLIGPPNDSARIDVFWDAPLQ